VQWQFIESNPPSGNQWFEKGIFTRSTEFYNCSIRRFQQLFLPLAPGKLA
jgi:hypothetical protein